MVYDYNLNVVMDLASIPHVGRTENKTEEMVENLKLIHESIKKLMEANNAMYKAVMTDLGGRGHLKLEIMFGPF